jgi:hypothetical protein
MGPRSVPPVRFEPTEKQITEMIIDLAQRLGWTVVHFRPAMNRNGHWSTPYQGDGVGFPDIVALRGRQKLVAELKVGRGRLTAEQEAWLAAFSLADIPAYVWKPEDLDGEILEALR